MHWCILLGFQKGPFLSTPICSQGFNGNNELNLVSSPKNVSVEDLHADVLGCFAEEVELRILDEQFVWIDVWI